MRKNFLKNTVFFIFLASVGILMFTACGGDTVKNIKVIEPSELISRDEAKDLLGVEVGEGIATEMPVVGLKMCVYEKEDAFLQIAITQESFMTKESIKQGQSPKNHFEETKAAFGDAKKIEGLGDDNFIAAPGVHILKGNYYITLSFGLFSDNSMEEKLKAGGSLAIENLIKAAGL